MICITSRNYKFTKHYFEGAGRIVSKLGNGTFAQPLGITAGGINYTKLTAEQQKALDTYVKSLGVPPGPPTQQGIYATPEFTGNPYPSEVIKPVEENQEPPKGWPRNPMFNAPGDVPGPPVQFGPPVKPATVKPGEGFTGIGMPENDIFYFHSDHLGSTSYISTKNGSVSQHVEYMAFGEVLFEEHSSSFSSPYKFNGKELDEETGLYYYGARYYDPRISVWSSVDPMAEKFPNTSPYTYCNNSPINLIDPDGKNPIFPFVAVAAVAAVYYVTAKLLENYGWNRNAKIVGYSMLHPFNAYIVGAYKKGSKNISTISSNFEINIVKNTTGLKRKKEGTDGNAIRHALWQAVITKDFGIDDAERIGNAHEDESNVDMKQRQFKDIKKADQTIDLLNNKIGRAIGKNHPNASNQELAKIVIEEFYINGLWEAKENEDGTFTIQKIKLTPKQYEEASNKVKKLRNDGLNK